MNPTAREKLIDHSEHEWAVILAGGDGTRLKSLTRHIVGDDRPKQFCSVLGRATLLEETRNRAALEVSREQILYLLKQLHREYYNPLLDEEPARNLVIQPCNRGTAPAILYSALRVASLDPQASVALFPSDHYISDNSAFMKHIRTALDAVRQRKDMVILLGLEPDSPETAYGWIEPSGTIGGFRSLRHVRRFWEKPDRFRAQVLQLRGCLWNSFVIVASVDALIEMIESRIPELYRAFVSVAPQFGTSHETIAIEQLYGSLEESNFSHQVLAHCPERLSVLKVAGLRWSDLGEPKRVLASLDNAGVQPHWAKAAAAVLA